MLERRSALAGFHGLVERAGVGGAIGLEIREDTGFTLVEIGAYPSKRAEAEQAVQSWLGALPQAIATPVETPKGLLMRTGPTSFWLVGPPGADNASAMRAAIPEAIASVIDLSSSRTRLSISGATVTDVLLKGIPIDLAPENFAVGQIALTGVHHTPILLHRTATDRYEIYAMRTFALTILEWLTDAALEFGYRVRDVKP
jgi:heterotetrameric sarcosine oxidase gamma subunit